MIGGRKMARFSRLEVLNTMINTGLVPVFYNKDIEVAKKVAKACAEGGSRILEFTNRGDLAYQVFTELLKYCEKELPQLILGIGSVIDPGTAAIYISCGTNFVVGPVLNPEVAKVCNRRKVPYSPGCGSVSEISQAEECGAEICKIFPGSQVGGPGFVKSVRGPMPWTRIMPTGGVDATEESIRAWFGAGVCCVGMGSKLITKEAVAKGDFEGIKNKVREVLGRIRSARGGGSEGAVFTGIEHVGFYPEDKVSAEKIVNWYKDIFGLKIKEGNSSFFASLTGPGRIEILKKPKYDRSHIAVRVSDFDAACKLLKEKGIELEEPKIKPDVKAVFLKTTDPLGHKIHLFWSEK
jgi:2-dehydro-3-deoxyphosphogluconate aldolase/(4S)-4-hydroxy-2-oxoglutarate aldolase